MRILSFLILTLLSIFISGCNSVKLPASVEMGEISGQEALFLQNKFIRVGVIPSSNGRIASIKYRPLDCEVLRPYEEKRELIDPLLPEQIYSNRAGSKEWFWGIDDSTRIITSMNAEVIYDNMNRAGIQLKASYYGGQPVEYTRKIILDSNSSVIKVEVTAKNIGKKKLPLSLWVNSIPQMSVNKSDEVIVPAKGNCSEIQGEPVLNLNHDQLINPAKAGVEGSLIAPSQPWTARVSHTWQLVMAYVFNRNDIMPNGLFHYWSGREGKDSFQSQEAILNPVELEPGQSHSWKYKIILYPNMFSISDIAREIAIRCRYKVSLDKVKLRIRVCSPVQAKAQWLEIKLRPVEDPVGGRSAAEARVMLPIMLPDRPIEVIADMKNVPAGKYRITVNINKTGYRQIPGPIIEVGKIYRFHEK